MSLYNMLHGVNPSTFFILPMLGEKHPDEYPRFRDCFIGDDKNILSIIAEKKILDNYPKEDLDFLEQIFITIIEPPLKFKKMIS